MRRTRFIELLAVLLLAPATLACLWDYDTLAAEARGRPGTAEVLVGWIDRWPDEVYEIRLQRAEASLTDDPSTLALYDDAGVACDRLGRHDEAIEWMARKRAALDALSAPNSEHEYRYHANLGTFYVHRWIHNGGDRDDIADVELAREHIAEAIEINPEAHFGREVVQLRLIESLLADEVQSMHNAEEEWADGLLGLVELGNAWESVDVFVHLHQSMVEKQGALGALAAYRVEELRDKGRRTLISDWTKHKWSNVDDSGEPTLYISVPDDDEPDVRAWYDDARRITEERNASRETYIMDKLDEGTHPDDVTWDVFFAGWSEPELPEMPDKLLPADPGFYGMVVGIVGIGSIVVVIGLYVLLRFRRAKRLRYSAA